jgi:hypothetical protein
LGSPLPPGAPLLLLINLRSSEMPIPGVDSQPTLPLRVRERPATEMPASDSFVVVYRAHSPAGQ